MLRASWTATLCRAFLQAKGHGIGSARDLIVHVPDAQLFWLGRITDSPEPMPDRERFSNIDDIRAHCAAANSAVRQWMQSLGDAGIEQEWEFSFRPGTPANRILKSRLWHHVALHGVGHRAEASELLTAAGSPPASLDLLAYYRDVGR